MVELEKARADLLSQTPKVITDPLRWKVVGERRWRLEARVLATELQEVLKLCGAVGRTNYSFVLLFENYPFRKLTYHHKHRKPDRQLVVDTLHKHTWSREDKDRDCYIPDDINPDADLNDILLQFLREENIHLTEPFQRRSFV